MDVLYRRNRFGLGTLRAINSKMVESVRITNDTQNIDTIVTSDLQKVFTWGNVRKLPSHGEIHNHPTLLKRTANKGKYRKLIYDTLNGAGSIRSYVGAIKTYTDYNSMEEAIKLGGTYILRPSTHHGASDFNILKSTNTDYEDALSKLDSLYKSGWYMSEYIPKSREFRVFVMHNKIVFMIEKIVDNPDAYAWNVAVGGRMVNVRWGAWDSRVILASLFANRCDKLQYGAYDIMIGKDDNKAYVLEVNTSPKVEEEYWSSCIAKGFDYAIRNNVTTYGLPVISLSSDGLGRLAYTGSISWRDVIHPALNTELNVNRENTIFNSSSSNYETLDDDEYEYDDDTHTYYYEDDYNDCDDCVDCDDEYVDDNYYCDDCDDDDDDYYDENCECDDDCDDDDDYYDDHDLLR